MRCPTFQCVGGTCSSSQFWFTRKVSMFAVTSISGFSAPTRMLSGAASLPLLIRVMAILISPTAGGVISMGKSSCVASMSGGFSGADLIKSSSARFSHLFLYSWSSVIGWHSLPLIGFTGSLHFLASFFVVSYSCLIFPSLAAISAFAARFSTFSACQL